MNDFHTDFHLNKMRRGKALAIQCSQRLSPAIAAALREAQVKKAGDRIELRFRDQAVTTFSFDFPWVEGGSVGQIADALTTLAHRVHERATRRGATTTA